MFKKKVVVPLVKYVYKKALAYLKENNSYSAFVIPKTACRPIFVLHTGASLAEGGADHVRPWIPLFKDAGLEFIVVVRDIDTYHILSCEYSDVPLSLITSAPDVDRLFGSFPSLRAFFYVANTANNNLFLRCSGGYHVFLGHGDSDKSSSMNRAFKVYDEIYVAGQAHIDRFLNADFDTSGMKFKIIGRPDNKYLSGRVIEFGNAVKKAIYLPTWEGYCAEQDYSSLRIFRDIVKVVNETTGLPVVCKLHPLTGCKSSEYLNIDEAVDDPLVSVEFFDRHRKLTDLISADAIFICDISAAVSECLPLGGPIFVYVPVDRDIRLVSGRMTYHDYAYTFSNAQELATKLKMVRDGNDPLADARRQALEYFVSPNASRMGAFLSALNVLASAGDVSPVVEIKG